MEGIRKPDIRQLLLVTALFAVILFLLTFVGFSDAFPGGISLAVIVFFSVLLIYVSMKTLRTTADLMVLLGAYVLRVCVLVADTLNHHFIMTFLNNGDSLNFIATAQQYYLENDFSLYLTNYPYFLYAFMKIFGNNELLLGFVNND